MILGRVVGAKRAANLVGSREISKQTLGRQFGSEKRTIETATVRQRTHAPAGSVLDQVEAEEHQIRSP